MKPSRELDEYIATRILGWTPAENGYWEGGRFHEDLPFFSNNGVDALYLLDKIKSKFDITQITMNGMFYSVNILGHDEVSYTGHNKRFPLALAEAALKAAKEMTSH